MEVYIGTIQPFAFNFAPRGWMLCAGQLLPISQYSALFSLIGTTYGGNGTSTFGLPDLRGRAVVGQGRGPGLSEYVMGEMTGTQTVTLLTTNMPQHNHLINASSTAGTSPNPANNYLAMSNGSDPGSGNPVDVNVYAPAANTTMNPMAVGLAGGNQPFSILQPLLTVNFCIAVEGIFPSRN
ncbi:MAG: phage tail protein [Caulobacter sp.]|nr:phage tail protein [Caulobacter sp.]